MISCPLIVIKSGVDSPVAIVTGVELSVPAASTPKAVLAAPADVAPVPPCATGSAVSNVNDAKENLEKIFKKSPHNPKEPKE